MVTVSESEPDPLTLCVWFSLAPILVWNPPAAPVVLGPPVVPETLKLILTVSEPDVAPPVLPTL